MYSQSDEEKYILQHVGNITGRFLDIGAYDGKTFSNTHALALKGWSGVCVEPSPSVLPALKELYKDRDDIKIHECCIGNEEGEITLWDSNGDALSTIFQEETTKWIEGWGSKFTPIKVPIKKLDSILEDVKSYEVVNIDVEGDSLGVDILFQVDLTNTRVVIVECAGKDREKASIYLYNKGFRLAYQNGENILMTR